MPCMQQRVSKQESDICAGCTDTLHKAYRAHKLLNSEVARA
jgi:hypothetical protein